MTKEDRLCALAAKEMQVRVSHPLNQQSVTFRCLRYSAPPHVVPARRHHQLAFFCVMKTTQSLPRTPMDVMPHCLTALKAYSVVVQRKKHTRKQRERGKHQVNERAGTRQLTTATERC